MQAAQPPSVAESDRLAGKYLTFQLGPESYGLEILKVREIIGLMDITLVPRTPAYTRGVINLRGKIIPVIDLRLTFGMDAIEDTERTCIIVMDIQLDDCPSQLGILVDAVSEVLDILATSIAPPPSFGTKLDAAFISGMARTTDSVTVLLDIDQVFNSTEALEIANIAATDGGAEPPASVGTASSKPEDGAACT
ncbi:MAG: purine-binding chemotaxis protein CheW [bacterium]|nr:purine-binding chemotaxis protein CheW [bacterium]